MIVTILVVLLIIYLLINWFMSMIRKWKKPTLYGSGAFKQFLENRSKLVLEKYCPPLICLNPAVQMFIRAKYEKRPSIKIMKDTLNMSDGGVVAFDRLAINEGLNDKDDHIILMVPGLRETTHTATILSLAQSLLLKGFPNIFVLNYRGSCSTPLMSKSCSAAFGKWNDVNEGITHLESKFPEKKIIIVGASMGAQFTVDYLSTEEANRPSIVGSVLYSCNWEQKSGPMKVTTGITYHLFAKRLIKDSLRRIEKCANEEERLLKEEWFNEQGVDKSWLRRSESLFDLEERCLAPLLGLSGAEEYYQKVSPVNKCHRVKKPVVIINSRDDFIATLENFNLPEFTKNPNLVLWSTAAGGHLSFVDGLFPVTSYLNKAVPECAALLCDFVQEEGDQLD